MTLDSAGPVEHVQTTLLAWQRKEKNVINSIRSCHMSVGNCSCHGARGEIFEYKYSNEDGGTMWLNLQVI